MLFWGGKMHPNPWLCFFGSVNQGSKHGNLPLEKYTFFTLWLCVSSSLFLKCLPIAFLKILFYFYLEDNYSPLIFCEIFCFLSPTQSYLHFSKCSQQADSVDNTPKPAKWGKRLSTSNGITILNQARSFSKLSLINSFYILTKKKTT